MKKAFFTIFGMLIFCGLFAQDMQMKSSHDKFNETCIEIPNGGSGFFPLEGGKLFRLTIKSCWCSVDARLGTYLIYTLNQPQGYDPLVLTVAETTTDWSFSYGLIGSSTKMTITFKWLG